MRFSVPRSVAFAVLLLPMSLFAAQAAAPTAKPMAMPGGGAMKGGHGQTPMARGFAKPGAPAPKAAANPACAYQTIDIDKYGLQPFADAAVIRSGADHVLTATLAIAYTDPATTMIAGCGVHLRSYDGQLVGPTLRVHPGDTMKITVRNDLPNNGMPCPMEHSNTMQDLDISNLHTHGLHVSPSGHSDNVFLEICPKGSKGPSSIAYEIDVPADQPPGTYWYHAHVHGSTAVQVSSGMEGALIVEGGVDTVPEIAAAKEKIFVLQQISYDQNGEIESLGLFTPNSWPDSKRSVTVNGRIAPVIAMQPGEVQHWRFIHAGVRETLPLFVQGGGALNEISTDGNALGRIDAWLKRPLELNPGYRSDVLFKAPPLPPGRTSMRYYLLSAPLTGLQRLTARLPLPQLRTRQNAVVAAAALDATLNEVQPTGVIAVIDVSGTPNDMALPTDAELAPFAPFKPITDAELNGTPQSMSFSIENAVCSGKGPCKPCTPSSTLAGCKIQFMVDDFPYPMGPVRQLKLNTASQWHLEVAATSVALTHPFHIHVNPFEMQRPGPDGQGETVWKDTILVHQGTPIDVRSRYTDFTGEFVLHCHILDHEDQGMMQKVEIVN